jgi:hypothetical protein
MIRICRDLVFIACLDGGNSCGLLRVVILGGCVLYEFEVKPNPEKSAIIVYFVYR